MKTKKIGIYIKVQHLSKQSIFVEASRNTPCISRVFPFLQRLKTKITKAINKAIPIGIFHGEFEL